MQNIKKEIRIHHTYIEQLNEKLLEDCATISIGHPSCIHKLTGMDVNVLENLLNKDKSVKIEIPILFDSHIEWLENELETWIKYPVGLVVNDMGVLYYLKQRSLPPDIEIILGRRLVFSYMHSPWYENIFLEEEPYIRNEWADLNIKNEEMVNFLHEYNIKEIETDLLPQYRSSIKYLKKRGFKVSGFYGYPIASLSRSCHSVRFYGGKIGECQHLCDLPLKLEPMERWNRFEDTMIRISKHTRDSMGNLFVYGNVVVQDSCNIGEDNYQIDSFIIDYRFSPVNMFS
jgi:hypothetical protein